MIRSRFSLGRASPRLLAILIVCLAPSVAAADTMIFTNECRVPVVLHLSTIINGRLARKTYPLRPLESTPAIRRASDMTVTVCDSKLTNRVLFQGGVRAGTVKLYFAVVPDKVPAKVQVIRRAGPPARSAMPPKR